MGVQAIIMRSSPLKMTFLKLIFNIINHFSIKCIIEGKPLIKKLSKDIFFLLLSCLNILYHLVCIFFSKIRIVCVYLRMCFLHFFKQFYAEKTSDPFNLFCIFNLRFAVGNLYLTIFKVKIIINWILLYFFLLLFQKEWNVKSLPIPLPPILMNNLFINCKITIDIFIILIFILSCIFVFFLYYHCMLIQSYVYLLWKWWSSICFLKSE